MKNSTENNGIKIGTTAIIWGCATGMMALCIPLVSVSHSGVILPLAVILGASVNTMIIWLSGNKKAVELSGDFQHIEQRVRNLETICSSDNFDSSDKSTQLKQIKQK